MKIKSTIHSIRSNINDIIYLMNYFSRVQNGKKYVALQFILTIIGSIFPIVYTILPGMIINELAAERNISTIIFYVLLLSMTPLLNHIIQLTLGAYSFRLKRELRICFKENLFSYIAVMKYESLENPAIAVQTNRICQGEPDAPLEMLDMLINFLSSLINIAFITSIVSVLNPIVIFVLIAILIINAAVTKKINENNYAFNKEASERNNKLYTYQDDLTNPMNGKEIRLFHAKDFFLKRYICEERKNEVFTQKNYRYGLKWRMIHVITNAFQQIFMYGIAVYDVIFHHLAVGSLTIFLSAANQFSGSLNNIVNMYLRISQYCMHVKEIKAFRNEPTLLNETGAKAPLIKPSSVIEFKNVSFKYPGSNRYALRDFNFKITLGEKICIVGANGSGKTTFIKLLTKLYTPTEGEILLDGVNIKEYDFNSYQKLFAPVFQDFCKYNLPIALNIALEDNFDKNRLDDAISRSGLASFMAQLTKGYDTYVGKRIDKEGIEPSGGEGQKIAIARAIYHDAPLYILDEPTAALDPVAEYDIYTKFSEMIRDRAAILVTHRMSAVQLADKVAVFDDGKIIEYGTHKDLYANGGIYTEMFNKQAQFYRGDFIEFSSVEQ